MFYKPCLSGAVFNVCCFINFQQVQNNLSEAEFAALICCCCVLPQHPLDCLGIVSLLFHLGFVSLKLCTEMTAVHLI